MGSGGSKDRGAPTAEGGVADSAGGAGGTEGERSWRWMRVGSACFRLPSSTASGFEQENVREGLETNACEDKTVVKSQRWRRGVCWKSKVPQPRLATCSSSSCSGNGGCQAQGSASHADPGDSSSSSTQTAPITWTSNSLSHSHSRFCFNTDGIASNLERAASLGSPRAQSVFPGSYSVQNSEEDDNVHKDSSGSSDSRSGTQEGGMASNSVSSQDIIGNGTGMGTGISGQSQTDLARIGNFERRPSRRHRTQEPLEGSIRFSRTLSVGRLRDRVLRGPSFSDRFFGHASLEDRVMGYHDDGIGRRALRQAIRGLVSSDDPTDMLSTSSPSHPTSMPSSADNSYDHVSETSQLGDASNRDILENRSAFIERRRRIRSQVRALQQLGNRVENFPGHDRSCILSGQHRMGHCTCRMNSRPANQDDSRSSRSSISRIVMLAEALFEVLDEIHQQAVVLASRPSVSSIGSVPAPKEVVERMPLRVYGRPGKHLNEEAAQEAAQCYICLVEYEEGDCVRILPCCHEFHRICVDKWLKEIHRVCPLCRGDVCTFGLPPA